MTASRDVLALHCGLASGAAWRGVQAALPGRRLICPDLPGHGAAADWDRQVDFQTQALADVLAALPDAPVDVIGHSFGGCLALRLLADHPARVRSLILFEPVMFAAADPADRLAHTAEMAPFARFLDADDRVGAAAFFHDLWGDGRPFAAMSDRAQAYIAARIHLIRACEPSILDDVHGVLDRLPALSVPCLILTRHAPPPIVGQIAAGLSARLSASVEDLGQGHLTPLTEPASLAARAQAFWGE
ncbi:alpha/beta fold hydrolase [Jannaschia pohangensis]|uniref:Pimeloyl-ACP methyl ester carboxylesterase n=1 Tax=Jannaschia pohangensis TaxID=390807 RepID=A0A1I3LKD7_9RHOB|nr:alpha/beta hydrolase [Jannaschia pohangensis]SFI84935.1 Pimeloyl-ACP methyl ester carboxylesterase [Jannaschia pohangensis]